jgi:hypothetical protein
MNKFYVFYDCDYDTFLTENCCDFFDTKKEAVAHAKEKVSDFQKNDDFLLCGFAVHVCKLKEGKTDFNAFLCEETTMKRYEKFNEDYSIEESFFVDEN